MSQVTVIGDEAVIADLRAKGHRATDLSGVLGEVARDTDRRIRGIPVDTGLLKASVRVLEVSDEGFVVGVGPEVPYAGYVFNGTQYMAAQPPKINANAVARDAADKINREIARA